MQRSPELIHAFVALGVLWLPHGRNAGGEPPLTNGMQRQSWAGIGIGHSRKRPQRQVKLFLQGQKMLRKMQSNCSQLHHGLRRERLPMRHLGAVPMSGIHDYEANICGPFDAYSAEKYFLIMPRAATQRQISATMESMAPSCPDDDVAPPAEP